MSCNIFVVDDVYVLMFLSNFDFDCLFFFLKESESWLGGKFKIVNYTCRFVHRVEVYGLFFIHMT